MHRRDALRWLGFGALQLAGLNAVAGSANPAHALPGDARLVTIGGGLTETVFALGSGERVVGADTTSTHPPEAESVPRVGYQRALTPESILAVRPYALLHDGSAGPTSTFERVRNAGVQILTVSGEPTMDGFRDRVRTVGHWLGVPESADRLVAGIEKDIGEARRTQSTWTRPPRLVVLMAHGQGNAIAAGRDTRANALIRLSGATNAFEDYSGYRPVSREGVLARRPDAMVITGAAAADFGGLLARIPQYAQDTLFLLGFGPRLGEAVLGVTRFLDTHAAARAAATQTTRA